HPRRVDPSVPGGQSDVVAKEHRGIGSEGAVADLNALECIAPVGGACQRNLRGVSDRRAAVVVQHVEISGDRIDGRGGGELRARRGVVVDARGRAPSRASIARSRHEDVRVPGARALIGPHHVDAASVVGVADVAQGRGQPIATLDSGYVEIPTSRLAGYEDVVSERRASVQRAIESNAAGPRPSDVDLTFRADGGDRSFYRVVEVEAVPPQVTHS